MSDFAPPGRSPAVKNTSSVAQGQRATLRLGKQALAMPEIERLTRPAEHYRNDSRITSESSRCCCADGLVYSVDLGNAKARYERLERYGHVHGHRSAAEPPVVMRKRLPCDRDQRIQSALGKGARVFERVTLWPRARFKAGLTARRSAGVDRRREKTGGFWVHLHDPGDESVATADDLYARLGSQRVFAWLGTIGVKVIDDLPADALEVAATEMVGVLHQQRFKLAQLIESRSVAHFVDRGDNEPSFGRRECPVTQLRRHDGIAVRKTFAVQRRARYGCVAGDAPVTRFCRLQLG